MSPDPRSRRNPAPRAVWILLAVSCLSFAGCATFRNRAIAVQSAFVRADYAQALAQLEKNPEPRSLLYQMERGLLLRYSGRLRESNEAFARATSIREDLQTRSVSNEAAALAVSDVVRPYRAAAFELPFLHLYPVLNYLELGDLQGAVVEARALSLLLQERRDQAGDARGDWGLGRLLAAMVFEAAGESNDARVAYLAATAAFAARPPPGPQAPSLAEAGLARASAVLGIPVDEAAARSDSTAEAALGERAISPSGAPGDAGPGRARVVFWVEEGVAPSMEEMHLRVPILKEEEHWDGDRLTEWSDRVGRRALTLRAGSSDFGSVEIAYLLDVALPVLPPPEPAPDLEVEARSGERRVLVYPAEDLDSVAREDLDARYPVVAARTAARAILKALATRTARKKSGEVAGMLTNLLGVATERADTRSWALLPGRIGLAVLDVPAGRGEVEVSAGDGGRLKAGGTYELAPGGWHFFSCRFFP